MLTLERIPVAPAQIRRPDPEAARFCIGEPPKPEHVRITNSSFFRPMQLLPTSRRKALYALFAFCGEVHGIAAGDTSRMLKLALLADRRAEVALLYAGRPQHVVTRALRDAVNRFELPFDDFRLIIDGLEMDTRTDIWGPSLAQLDLYCERAAVAVGRIALRIFGMAADDVERVAAALGRGLQLTGILRDLAQDARRQRLYLPRELLHAHGIFATMPSYVLAQPALAQVCNVLAERAAAYFADAEPMLETCSLWPMRPAAAILSTYRTMLGALLSCGWVRLDESVCSPGWRQMELLTVRGLTGR